MHCYKCQTTEGLSIKARHRNGDIRIMICKPCRNNYQRHYKTTRYRPDIIKPKDWDKLAKENHKRIIELYGKT